MMRGAPLLVDFLFVQEGAAYDDVAYDAAFVQLMDADANADGDVTWDEVAAAPRWETHRIQCRCRATPDNAHCCSGRTTSMVMVGSAQRIP